MACQELGFGVAAGVDVDDDCQYPFEYNNNAKFICRDVDYLLPSEVVELFDRNQPQILVGCAPCQPFSMYNQKKRRPKLAIDWAILRARY